MSVTRHKAAQILNKLHHHGFQAYLVGGCVRDQILKKVPKDYDIATDATPEEVLKIFPEGDLVGASFGVVLLDGIEIATFRSEGHYSDGRRPDNVVYAKTPLEDSKRRDFTVNAIYYDLFKDRYLDFHNGMQDLENELIRTVGNPNERFREDYLRMLRAVRFAVRLNFRIEEETLKAIQNNSDKIQFVSKERILQELKMIFSEASKALTAFEYLMETNLMKYIFPEIVCLPQTKMGKLKEVLRGVEKDDPIFIFTIFAFFSDSPLLEDRLQEMKMSVQEKNAILDSITLLYYLKNVKALPYVQSSGHVIKRLIRDVNFPYALELYTLLAFADVEGYDCDGAFGYKVMRNRLLKEELFPPKIIDGNVLKELGIPEGPIYKRILHEVEDAQLRGELRTPEEAKEFSKEFFASTC